MSKVKKIQSKEEQLYVLKELFNLEKKRNKTYLTKELKTKSDTEKALKWHEEAKLMKTEKPARVPNIDKPT